MTQSMRFGAPFLQAGQAQKEITVNEAFALFDFAVSAAVDGFLQNTPPSSPTVGGCFIVGTSPGGDWSGQANALAGYTAGGWRFIAPFEGLAVLDKPSGERAVFRSGAWEKGNLRAAKVTVAGNQVVGSRAAAVADPSGGTTVDAQARTAIADILARLRQHGLIAP